MNRKTEFDLRKLPLGSHLSYEVPHIPANHTALVLETDTANIDWQERMLPWTLASLVNNTDLVMKGVHIYIAYEAGTEGRVKKAVEAFDFVGAIDRAVFIEKDPRKPFPVFGAHGAKYDSVCLFDIRYWAFRCGQNRLKLPIGHVLKHNYFMGVAAYSLHPANTIDTKSEWGFPTQHLKRRNFDDPSTRVRRTQSFMDAGERARWLHDANRAVYGEAYDRKTEARYRDGSERMTSAKKPPNVAEYLFNASEPNWHVDASILQYSTSNIAQQTEWFTEWRHLGRDALVMLWLLKIGLHAYNFSDSLIIDGNTWTQFNPEAPDLPAYPRLCKMATGSPHSYRYAIQHLMGADLALNVF